MTDIQDIEDCKTAELSRDDNHLEKWIPTRVHGKWEKEHINIILIMKDEGRENERKSSH